MASLSETVDWRESLDDGVVDQILLALGMVVMVMMSGHLVSLMILMLMVHRRLLMRLVMLLNMMSPADRLQSPGICPLSQSPGIADLRGR